MDKKTKKIEKETCQDCGSKYASETFYGWLCPKCHNNKIRNRNYALENDTRDSFGNITIERIWR